MGLREETALLKEARPRTFRIRRNGRWLYLSWDWMDMLDTVLDGMAMSHWSEDFTVGASIGSADSPSK